MIFKKIVLLVLVFTTALSMSSCSVSENYYLELEIRTVDGSTVCLKSNNELNQPIYLGLDTSMNLGFYATVTVVNSKTKASELSFIAQPLLSKQYGFNIEEYDIVDNAGNKERATLTHTIDADYHAIHSGYLAVQRIAGIHELKVTVPKLSAYGIEKTSFNISCLVDEDAREDAVEIIIDDSVEYEKIDLDTFGNKDNYHDIYYCKKYPVFKARVKNSGEILSQEVFGGFRKLDENYYFNVPWTSISESGVYLCRVYYIGTEKYRALDYYCYIIL